MGIGRVLVPIGSAAPPEQLIAPVVRRLELRLREARRDVVGIVQPHRDRQLDGAVRDRVDHCQAAVSRRHTVDRPAAVDRRIALVGRDLVVDEGAVLPPVPQRNDQVPLDAARPGRARRGLARRDPGGPVGEHLERALPAEPVHRAAHRVAALAGLDPMVPRRDGRVEVVEVLHDARRRVAKLMAELTPLLHDVDPRPLALEVLRNTVAVGTGAGELMCRRWLDQRVPVVAGVVLRCSLLVRRHDAGERHVLPARGQLDLRRVDQPIAADPDIVGRLGQLGQQEPTTGVRHHDLGELGLQLVGFRNHPDTGLRAVVTGDGAGDDAVGHAVLASRGGHAPDGNPDDHQQNRHEHNTRAKSGVHLCCPPATPEHPRGWMRLPPLLYPSVVEWSTPPGLLSG